MVSTTMSLHQLTDGTYRVVVMVFEDGQGSRVILQEESHPLPEVPMSSAWGVAAQMAQEAIAALEPSTGLWAAVDGFRTE